MNSDNFGQKTILVVDDNKDNLRVIAEYLKEEGHKILIAASGEIALQRVARKRPDLILLDVKMPGMNGFEVCQKLKENSETSDIPVIFVTALAETESIKTGFETGGVDYLTKPVNKTELIARVRNHLEITSLRHNLEKEVEKQTDALRKAQNYISNIIDSMPSILISVDNNGYVTRWNKKAETLTGIEVEKANGKHLFDVLPQMVAEMDKIKDSILNRQINNDTEKARQTDTGTIYEDITIYPLTANCVEGAVIRIDDVTYKHNLEQQLFQSQKMEAIGTLAGGIAHDFNNLLSVIVGYAELIKSANPAECRDQAEEVNYILSAAKRAGELVKQILSFSRKSECHLEPLRPHLIVKEALQMLRASMPSSISIQQDIDPECGEIMANPTSLHQIVINLCTNAMQAMKNEQGTLTVNLCRKDIPANIINDNSCSPGPFIVLTVADTGEGMSRETVSRIFEPYFTTKEMGKGTGLGLATVHGIVKELNGFIEVDSQLGQGTIFRINIPALPIATGKQQQTEQHAALPTGTENILCVDDESVIVNMSKSMLERLGYNVTTTNDSTIALAKIMSNPEQFDLLITDQTMPNLTGFDLAKEILTIRPDYPIILSTGYSSVVTEEEAFEHGIKGYLKKPFTRNDLAQIVRKVLDMK